MAIPGESQVIESAATAAQTRRRRFPLHVSQEFFLACFGDEEPPTIHVELRVSGSIEEARLRSALAAAVATHPKARARLASRRVLFRRPSWEVVEPEASDAGANLEVVGCDEDPAMQSIRSAFCSRPIDLSKAPAMRFLLVRRAGGDSFLMSIHHAITDGIGALRLVNSIARNYAEQPDPVPDVDPMEPLAIDSKGGNLPSTGSKAARLSTLATGPISGDPGFGVCLATLPSEECARLDPRPHGPDASLNDLLLAAIHATIARWNADRGANCEGVAIRIPVNLRPSGWNGEIVGNLSVVSTHITSPADRGSTASLMASVLAHTAGLKASLGSGLGSGGGWKTWLAERVAFPIVLPLIGLRPRKMPPITRMLFSNLGRIERKISGFGPEAGPIVEFWSSPPIAKPMGLGIVTCLFRGRLQVAIRYRLAVLGADDARAFADLYLDELRKLGRPGEVRACEAGSIPG